MKTPTQRSLQFLRKRGGLVAVVEKWNPHARIRQDLFGFADIICVSGDTVALVQSTSQGHAAARERKIAESAAANFWLSGPNRTVFVHGWSRVGARGRRKTWQCDERQVTLRVARND